MDDDNTHLRTIVTSVVPISCKHSQNIPACAVLWLPYREITSTRKLLRHANARCAATLRTYGKRTQGMRDRTESVTRLSRLHCETIRLEQTCDATQTPAVEQDANTRITSARARLSAVQRKRRSTVQRAGEFFLPTIVFLTKTHVGDFRRRPQPVAKRRKRRRDSTMPSALIVRVMHPIGTAHFIKVHQIPTRVGRLRRLSNHISNKGGHLHTTTILCVRVQPTGCIQLDCRLSHRLDKITT